MSMLNCFMVTMPEKEGKILYETNRWNDFVEGAGPVCMLDTISLTKKTTIDMFFNSKVGIIDFTNWKQAYKRGYRIIEIEIYDKNEKI